MSTKPLVVRVLPLILLVAGCAACDPPPPERPPAPTSTASKEDVPPEAATGYEEREPVAGGELMVAAANPHASKAGFEILKAGGSAVDAAIAMGLVLTLVEPQSSGIGGGAFLMRYDAESQQVTAYDGRETAPAAATATMFMNGDEPKGYFEALVGGLSVGVPGQLRMFERVHREHGQLPWKRLFEPAVRLAEEGFAISPRLEKLVAGDRFLEDMPEAASYFLDDGEAKPAGTILNNPALAEVLSIVADEGADAFYEGAIAEDVVKAARSQKSNPGRITTEDMAGYRPVKRDAVCDGYRGHRLCGMPPPSSGGITTLEILGLLERFDLGAHAAGSVDEVHLFAEAGKLAYADRARYIADPAFVSIEAEKLLDEAYLERRSALIDDEQAMGEASAGEIDTRTSYAEDASHELPSTSHLVAVDAEGDVVSMTASIEYAFGSHVMVRGFLLNNELTDFSFVPERKGEPVANRVEPGKRPRSSMAPFIALDAEGRFSFAVGSPGGSRIIPYVARTLIAVIDHGLGPQEAIDHPNFANRNGPTELEALEGWESWGRETKKGLEARGHRVRIVPLNSGLQAVLRTDDGYRGGADPRREGLVIGE